MTCPSCGQQNPGEARFCLQCATPLGGGAAPVSADPQRAALERVLGAHYDIGRLLGRGGMGAVYLAREQALDRTVAIKVLPPDLAADAESRERFRREARTAAKLTHPNIVPLHSFGEAEGMPYFVMGYVRGESLGDRLARAGRLPADEVRRILGELADALDYAHRQGVVHRDIKPDNVLLDDESGRAMLTDFGVAKARAGGATLTEAGAVVGTPHYMSPEQASGARDLDGRSDLYSLGVMGYQMLSGRLPFEGESYQDVIVKHVSVAPLPLGVVAGDAPDGVIAVVTRCLAKEPAERWPDGAALREALAQDDGDLAAPHPNRWLRAMDGDAVEVLLVGYAAGIGALLYPVLNQDFRASVRYGLIGVAVGAALEAAGVAWLVWRGHPWAELKRLMLRPKRWWPLWWPRAWRRPGDVWDRLPGMLKATRIAQTISVGLIAGFGALVCYLIRLPAGPSPFKDLLGWTIVGTLLPIPLLMGGTSVALWRWSRRRGLSWEESAAAASGPTVGPTWKRRTFAALLAPAGAAAGAGSPRDPQQLLRAIADAAAQLSGPLREAGGEAVGAARQLVESLAALDAELGQLTRDANPAELAEVERKLAGLGDPAADNAARRRMRSLLADQRALLRGLAEQLAAATQHRAQLLDLLRTLWLQVASLRAEAAREARADTEITGRIRAAVAEVARHTAASSDVRRLVQGGE